MGRAYPFFQAKKTARRFGRERGASGHKHRRAAKTVRKKSSLNGGKNKKYQNKLRSRA